MPINKSLLHAAVIAILVLISWQVLSQGIHDQLLLDDRYNLAPLQKISESPTWETIRLVVFDNQSGALGRPVSMASFLVDGHTWPLPVNRLIRTNVLLHIATGLCLLWFCLLLSQQIGLSKEQAFRVSMLVTTIWLFHPLLTSTYLYAIQRMAILSSILSLLSFIVFLKVRTWFYSNKATRLLGASVLLAIPVILALAAKENSAVILSLIALIEILILSNSDITPDKIRRALIALMLISTPLALAVWLAFNTEYYAFSSQVRGFDLVERLLTQSRVLLGYLNSSLIPGRVGSGIFQDDIEVSRTLLSPITTLPATMIVIGLIASITFFFKRYSFICFALAWFFIAHLIEGSVIPLELKFEHRNYLPLMGLLFGIVLAIEKLSPSRWYKLVPYVFAVICITTTASSITLWTNPLEQAEIWRIEHPKSSRAALHAARLWVEEGNMNQAHTALKTVSRHQPNLLSISLQLVQLECLSKSINPETVSKLLKNGKIGELDYSVPHALRALGVAVFNNNCDGLSYQTVLDISNNIGENPKLATHEGFQSETYSALAFLYQQKKDHINAAKYSNRAFNSTQDAKYAMAETIHWINAGKAENAKASLKRVEENIDTLAESKENEKRYIQSLRSSIQRMSEN